MYDPAERGIFFIVMDTLLGTKQIQSQQFTAEGKRIPVTTIQTGPCFITKIIEGGHYRSVQLSFGTAKHTTKALDGHIKKAGLTIRPRFLREVRVEEKEEGLALGVEYTVDKVFQVGDIIQVTGISKGKGFAGVVKRHGFAGGPRTHGQSDRERAPGSIGQTTTPGRVYKGKRMAGRMGSDTVTVKGLSVVSIDSAAHTMTVKGVVPGGKGGLLTIQKVI